MLETKRPCILLGGGGHARVLLEALRSQGLTPIGLTDPDEALWRRSVMGLPVLGDDDEILHYPPTEVVLVNGLGSTFSIAARRALFERWRERGYSFAQVVHSSATVSPTARLGPGAQLLAGSIINANAEIGANSIVNTGSIVEHDCRIGQHVHLAPGGVLSGGVEVGDGCHLGTGAVVIQNVSIGAGCVVGAGAVVTASLKPFTLALGVPARVVRSLVP